MEDNDHGVPAVPTTAFDSPASYTDPSGLDPASFGSNRHDPAASADPSTESAGDIPTAALLAYQRAEAVLHKADPSCQISWELIAAIGRVESDHGRYSGNILGSNGKSKPGIYGMPLDGSQGTVLIEDTDGGAYDNDTTYDRAVGAMQIIPGTWELVGVDGDGDGVRDPQDIDDSSLAAAVYLCAGDYDLSTTAGQRSAVFSYNNSQAYVDLVLSIMTAYLDGDYTTVADGLPSATYIPAVALSTSARSTQAHSNYLDKARSTSRASGAQRPAGTTAPSRRPGQSVPSTGIRPPRPSNPPPTTSNPGPGNLGPTTSNPGPGNLGPTTSNPGPGNLGPTTSYPGPGNPAPTTSGPPPTTTNPGPGTPGPTTSNPTTSNPTTSSPTTSSPVPSNLPTSPVPTSPVPTSPTATATVAPVVDPVVKATRVCEAAFADADYIPNDSEMDRCIDAYLTGGMAAVNALIDLLTAVPVPTTPVPTTLVPTSSVPPLPTP